MGNRNEHDNLGIEPLAIDPNVVFAAYDPDVWPPPTPDPPRDVAPAAAENPGGAGGPPSSRGRREGIVAGPSTDRARQRLPAWAKVAIPRTGGGGAGGIGDRRGSGHGAGEGVMARRDSVVRGGRAFAGPGVGGQIGPRRESRGKSRACNVKRHHVS